MLHQNTISFLENLSKNNNKTWFDEHRKDYETAKKDFEGFVNEVLGKLSEKEPEFKEQKAKDCVFRIFRDVRFAKDKTPYKANFGASFNKGGKKCGDAGYYIHLEPGKSFLGGGLWMPETTVLKKIRQEVDYNFDEFQKMIKQKDFKKLFKEIDGEQLKKAPQGYSEDNLAIEYLKMKSFTVGTLIEDKEITSKDVTKRVTEVFTTMKPFLDFLNRAID